MPSKVASNEFLPMFLLPDSQRPPHHLLIRFVSCRYSISYQSSQSTLISTVYQILEDDIPIGQFLTKPHFVK